MNDFTPSRISYSKAFFNVYARLRTQDGIKIFYRHFTMRIIATGFKLNSDAIAIK